MNSQQIEYFLTVAECLNFTEAGERLYASQTTISRQISVLEAELGFQLFYRDKNTLRLTPAGAIMIPTYNQMNEFFNEQKKIAAYTSSGQSGQITIGFLCNMNIDIFFIDLLEQFQQKYPNIIVNHCCFPEGNVEDSLRSDEIDILFAHDFDQPVSPQYVSDLVCETNMFLVYGEKHKMAKKEHPTIHDFAGEHLWTTGHSDTRRREMILHNLYQHYKMSPFKKSIAPNFDSALLNIRLGNGVAFLDPLTMHSIPACYKKLLLDDCVSKIGISLTWKKNNLNPTIALFSNLVSTQK